MEQSHSPKLNLISNIPEFLFKYMQAAKIRFPVLNLTSNKIKNLMYTQLIHLFLYWQNPRFYRFLLLNFLHVKLIAVNAIRLYLKFSFLDPSETKCEERERE